MGPATRTATDAARGATTRPAVAAHAHPDHPQRSAALLPRTSTTGLHRLVGALSIAGNRATVDLLDHQRAATATPPAVQRRDLHAGASVPDAAAQSAITGAMNPSASVSSSGTVTVRTWGGRLTPPSTTPTRAQQRVRNQTLAALRRAINGALNQALPDVRSSERRYARGATPTTDLAPAGNAAADVVRGHVGGYIRNSVGGAARIRHGFVAGANLLDAYDPSDRATAGEPISAEAVVEWALRNSPAAAVRSRFAFNPDDSDESRWLRDTGIAAIIGGRRTEFELWDQFGFAMVGSVAGPMGDRVLATTVPPAGLSGRRPPAGGLSPAQRGARWFAFQELMHEFFHLVEHPVHETARQASSLDSALNEGVTDILTEDAYNSTVARVRRDPAVITAVEGRAPARGAAVPERYLPRRYPIAYPDEVADVRGALGSVNLDGFKAAYLTGHVEYVGLLPGGADRPPVAAGTGQGIDLHSAAVFTLAQLSRRTGVAKRLITGANPGVRWSPLPARANVPGWREHVVVSSSGLSETRDQIAAQHDVSVADLNANNGHLPGWPLLPAGRRVLIPPPGFRP